MPKPTYLFSLLLLLFLPGISSATTFTIAGFGDSLTCDTCNDGSYLRLLDDFLTIDPPIIDDNGVSANRTSSILTRLDTWINDGFSADLLILMGGTVDTYQAVGGLGNQAYDSVATLGNLTDMVNLVLGEGIPLLLMAPPPVASGPCGSPVNLTCGDLDTRLSDLAADVQLLAAGLSVPFVNLYDVFSSDPRLLETPGSGNSLFRSDGLHLQLATGDTLIASTIAPLVENLLTGGSSTSPAIPAPEPTAPVLFSLNLLIAGVALRRRKASARAA